MKSTNVITIEKNIPIPELSIGRSCGEKYNFISKLKQTDSFSINGNTPDFNPCTIRAHIYKLNATTERKYTIRTIQGPSARPLEIRVWRTQ